MPNTVIGNLMGQPGANGTSPFTITTASFTVPPVGQTVDVTVGSSIVWAVLGQMVWVDQAGGGPGQGATLQVTAKTGNTLTLLNPGPGPAVSVVPTGTVLDYAGSIAPAGFLICDGSAVSRTANSDLFNVIGTAFGPGDGSTTFNLPDLRGRSAVGAGAGTGLTNRTLGASGGEETHLLSVAEMPSHTHAFSPDQALYTNFPTTTFVEPQASGWWANNANPSIAATGGDTPHNTMPPFAVLNKIIKT